MNCNLFCHFSDKTEVDIDICVTYLNKDKIDFLYTYRFDYCPRFLSGMENDSIL